MGRNFEMKQTILSLLMAHKRTLTDISLQAGRSPSTVKQHLIELQAMGKVRYVDEAHLGRYKYYECVPVGALGTGPVMVNGAPESWSRLMVRAIAVRRQEGIRV